MDFTLDQEFPQIQMDQAFIPVDSSMFSATHLFLSDDFQKTFKNLPDYSKEDEENDDDLFGNSDNLAVQSSTHLQAAFQRDYNIQVLDAVNNSNISSSSHPQKSKQPKRTRKPKGRKRKTSRKKDNNMSKKYSRLAQNILLTKLGLSAQVQPYFRHKHRQDYFFIMLMLADHAGKMIGFKKHYIREASKLKESLLSSEVKISPKNSWESVQRVALAASIDRTFISISLFEKGEFEGAIQSLFDLENLRNHNFVSQSIQFVTGVRNQLQMGSSRIS